MYKEEKPLKAVEVLFCDNNLLELQAAIFAGKDKTTFLDIKEYHGTVFDILAQAETYISKNIHWRVEFQNFKRVEIPEIPIDAIREALVNSLCHRDYFKPEANKISIFQNRVEIWNPGNFPEGMTPEDYIKGEEESVLRNPLIARILYYSRDIEKWGSGLKRMYDECNSKGVEVNFKNLKSGFKVIFQRDTSLPLKTTTLKTTQRTTYRTTQRILDLIKENPSLTRTKLAELLNISQDGVKYQIDKLKKEGVIRRKGGKTYGHWEIIEPK